MKKIYVFTVLFCLVAEQSMASGFWNLVGNAAGGSFFWLVIPGIIITIFFKIFFPKKEDPHGHGHDHGHGGHGDHGHGHDNGNHGSHGGHDDKHGHDSHDKKHDNHAPKHDTHEKHDSHGDNHGHPKPAQKSGGYNHHDNDNARRFGQKADPHH